MSTGETIAVVAGVGAVGLGGLLLLRRLQAVPPNAPAAAQVVSRAASPSSVAASAIGTIQSLNATGCGVIASKSGVPSGIAKAGCSSYVKYLSPIGATQTIIHAAEKIPVVGKAISATENAVSKVASVPINAVKSLFSSIF